jgi:hypothetical protein
MTNERKILCLSFDHIFHPNFSMNIKHPSFHLPPRNGPPPFAIYQKNTNMHAPEQSGKKRISGIKFTKAVYVFDADVEVH